MQSILSSGKRRAAIIAATLSLTLLGGCYYAHTDTHHYGGSPGYYRHGGYGYGHGYRGHYGHSHYRWHNRGHRYRW
jgi:hypothetical protein